MPLATSPSSDRLPSRPSKRVTAPRPHGETVSRVRVSMVSEKDEPAAAGRARLPTGPTGPRPRPDPDLSRISSRQPDPDCRPVGRRASTRCRAGAPPAAGWAGSAPCVASRPPFPVSGLPRTPHPRPTPLRTAVRARSAARRGAPRRPAPAWPGSGRPPHPRARALRPRQAVRQAEKGVWLRPLRRDWKRTLNR